MKLRELHIRYAATPLEWNGRKRCNTPREAAAVIGEYLRGELVEIFGLLLLDTKHKPLALHTVSRGTLDTTVCTPREVFRAAILGNAAALVLFHNHPSGDPTPSADDLLLTSRLVEAGALMGINVVDHVIVADPGRYFSCAESGMALQGTTRLPLAAEGGE